MNNSDINNKYNIYEKNYFNNNKNLEDNLEDTNSELLFNDGIKEEEKFFYSVNNQSEKSYKTLNFTEMGDLTNNNNNNLLNSSLTDSSSILDLKKFLNQNTSEKMEDELEIDSFLFEDNNKNYFKYNNNKIKNDNSINPPKNKEINNKNINNNNINNTKKRVGYVFEIKVENELKKLILKKGEDKNLIVKNFCEKYGINEEEKIKIIKIIDERLKNYTASQNLI